MSTTASLHTSRWLAFVLALGCAHGLVACEDAEESDPDASDGHDHDHDHDHVAYDASAAHDAADDVDAGASDDASTPDELYAWPLPSGFPVPVVPVPNPVTPERVELGRHLFYDKRLSGNGTQSCGSCHEQARAFTDGRAVGLGATGESHVRGSMSLTNVAYASAFTWANPTLRSLESQALVPLFGESPVELGLSGKLDDTLAVLRDDARYRDLFAQVYPGVEQPITLETIIAAIASFERALISGNSAYDRHVRGEHDALSDEAKRGMSLFFSEALECFHCHGGFNFSGAVTHESKAFDETTFHNNGLYNLDGQGAYPEENTGLHAFTGKPEDMGRFKAPTLRNIAVTAPYMHDGSIATLREVIVHYSRGGRVITEGPHAGDGRVSPVKSEMVGGFLVTAEQIDAVVAFLESLTDEEFLSDPRYADPFATAGTTEP